MLGEVSGATLKRRVYFGSRGQGSSEPGCHYISNVAVKRPHMIKATYRLAY
jgi:hypothetical protein